MRVRPVLVALGLRHDGRKEIIDFRLTRSESGPEWESFLANLMARGLSGIEVICGDGSQGLMSALPEVYPDVPVQRCLSHKMRDILDKVPGKEREEARRGLAGIYHANGYIEARAHARRWARSWIDKYPEAVKCLEDDLDEQLICFRLTGPGFGKAIRTTNAIERRFREVRSRSKAYGRIQQRNKH